MPLTAAQKKSIVAQYKEMTGIPSIALHARRGACTVFDSKLGGAPYLPKDTAYPMADASQGGGPLRLLAQLNFEQLPKIPGYPQRGILQFYIACSETSDLYGADLDDPTAQNGFRVIYHPDIVRDLDALETQIPQFDDENSEIYFPFKGEFLLTGEETACPMTPSDYRFDGKILDLCKKAADIKAESVFDLDSEWFDELVDALGGPGHCIGGYPFFTQEDPRGYSDALQSFTKLLLQIDSDGSGEDEIMWGDCGVANFFIEPEALERLDFSRVLYYWDCC